MARWRIWLIAVLMGIGIPSAQGARAQEAEAPKLVAKTAVFVWDKSLLRMNVSYRDVIDEEMRQKLASGLPTVIVLRGYVFEVGASTPIALTAKSCRIVFDPWDEVFRIQLAQPGGESNLIVATLEGVLRRCAETQFMPVVDHTRLTINSRYMVQGIVEINPISQEMVERIKRWVSRPAGATNIGAGDALFGSFVGLFVARVGSADRHLRFRTQAFLVASLPPQE